MLTSRIPFLNYYELLYRKLEGRSTIFYRYEIDLKLLNNLCIHRKSLIKITNDVTWILRIFLLFEHIRTR